MSFAQMTKQLHNKSVFVCIQACVFVCVSMHVCVWACVFWDKEGEAIGNVQIFI